MKQQVITWQIVALATLLLTATATFAQSNSSLNSPNREANFYCNPLVLNNKPFNYADFSIISKGELAVVAGNPKTADAAKIPFRIYLRRNGKIINSGVSDTTLSVTTIDVATVLAIAQAGDTVIIEPTRKSDAGAKRSIKLKEYSFDFNLFSFVKNKDGC